MNPDEIKKAREKLGLTTRELGDKAGVSASTVSRLERGLANIGFEKLLMIYRALGLNEPDMEVYAETIDERRLLAAWRDEDYSVILRLVAEKLEKE